MQDLIGRTLGQYRVVEMIGAGGMGEVFLAVDTTLDRKVALKFLPGDAVENPVARGRFLREAKSAAALDNPFICKVYETREVDGKPFIAMEYVEGESLRTRLSRGPLPLEETVRTASEVAEALAVAHEHGIIHRDLKPSNIMLTTHGHAKVVDFGLAKQVFTPGEIDTSTETASSDDLTGRGVALGTLSYMSPEQIKAQSLTPRSDVFSFGVVLHEMLSGEHPFSRPTSAETISAIVAEQPPPPSNNEARIPDGLVEIHDKALAKEPEDRYQNAAEIVGDLAAFRRSGAPAKKVAHTIGIAAAVILAAIVVVVGFRLPRNTPETDLTEAPEALSVLVADFDNRTGEEVFTRVLGMATSIVIEDAPFVTLFKRRVALEKAEAFRPNVTVLDEELAGIVANNEGLDVVITGSVEKRGQDYVFWMNAKDPVSGEVLLQQQSETDDHEEVFAAVGRMAGRVREKLGDADSEAIRRSAEESFTALPIEAAHAYVQAQELLTSGKWQEAADAFFALAEENPEMGRAYSGIGAALGNMGRRDEAYSYFKLTLDHSDKMTELEMARARGIDYLMRRKYEMASVFYEQVVEAFPFDEAARVNLVLGYFYGRRMDKALVAARNAVEAFPQSAMAQANLALVALYASEFEAANTYAKSVIEAHPAYETTYVCLGLSQLALDDTTAAINNYERLAGISDWGASLAAAGLADIAVYEGRLSDAVNILEGATDSDLEGGDEAGAAIKLFTLAHVELTRGRPDRAVAAAQRAVDIGQQDQVLFEAARVLLAAGRKNEAISLASQLAERLPPEPRCYSRLIKGEIALDEGDPTRALAFFREAQSILDTWIGRVYLGRAHLESGAFLEAHREFEVAMARRGEAASVFLDDLPTYHYLPPVYYYLGRALEGLDSAAAAESYRTFLEIKAIADGDPLVEEARRRSRLSRQPQ